jgi:hypothetical protein
MLRYTMPFAQSPIKRTSIILQSYDTIKASSKSARGCKLAGFDEKYLQHRFFLVFQQIINKLTAIRMSPE